MGEDFVSTYSGRVICVKNKNLKKDEYFSLLASHLKETQFNQTQCVCVIISRSKRKLALSNFTPFRTKDASIKNLSIQWIGIVDLKRKLWSLELC